MAERRKEWPCWGKTRDPRRFYLRVSYQAADTGKDQKGRRGKTKRGIITKEIHREAKDGGIEIEEN